MKLFLKIFFLLATCNIIAQKSNFIIPDSLKQKSFSELNDLYYGSKLRVMDSIYANTYLQKGIAKNDSIEIAKGYLFLTAIAENSIEKEKLINKSIKFSRDKVDFLVPCTAYSIKASLCKQKKKFKEALDYYLLTHTSAEKGKNIDLKYITKYNIGLLKSQIAHHDETIDYMSDCISYFNNSNRYSVYISSLCVLSNSYTYKLELDVATDLNSKGIKFTLENNDVEHYNYFILYEGVNRFYKGEYNSGIDSLKKVLPYLKKSDNNSKLAIAYYYLGQSYNKIGKVKKSKSFLIKVDSIFSRDNYLPIYSRNAYRILWELDKENKLYYINQLLKLDSILIKDYKVISSTLYKEYERYDIIKEKDDLEKNINRERRVFNNYLLILIIILIAITLTLLFNFYKRKKYQKRYLELTQNTNTETNIEISKTSINKIQNNSDLNNEIDQEIITKTLNNLSKFEFNKGYLDNKITLNNLAKRVGTNSRYLSKIINSYKKKSYSNYINDLRINYIVNKLRSDEKFRKYTIDVIAQEAGFNSRRSFSNVFQKKTGISTAFFINKLEEGVK